MGIEDSLKMYGFGAQGLNGNNKTEKPFMFNIISSALWRAHSNAKSKRYTKLAGQLYFIEFGEELLVKHGKEKLAAQPLQPGPSSTYYYGCDRTYLSA